MNRGRVAVILFALSLAPPCPAGLVSYDAGRITIDGVQLLQDAADPKKYYYLPSYPRLAVREDGSFEFSLIRFVGENDESTGAVLHALFEFRMPEETLRQLETKLKERVPGASIAGVVELQPMGENGQGSFEVVSATLAPGQTPDRIDGKLITSGVAPVSPGSKAALAAMLPAREAQLLSESLKSETADLSIAVRAFYEAKVEAYNAVVRANMDTIYQHRSVIDSVQREYTRRQVRNIADQLVQSGAIKVEIFDHALPDRKSASAIVDMVTDKLIELMFDAKSGWSREPAPEVAVEANQLLGRQERGWFSKTFLGSEDTPYYTDDQFVVKKRSDVRSNSFVLNLSQSTVIRVPFATAGNVGGFREALPEAERARYFRVVPLNDPVTERREVFFQVDGDFAEGFSEFFDQASVNVRRSLPGRPVETSALRFDADTIQAGAAQMLKLLRLGVQDDQWTNFEYQVVWHVRGVPDPIRVPKNGQDWLKSHDVTVGLTPPFFRESLEINVDTAELASRQIQAAVVQLVSEVNGSPRIVAQRTFRATDAESIKQATLFGDVNGPRVWRAIWHSKYGRARQPSQLIGGPVIVRPPDDAWLQEHSE